ncbi:hypothetical protein ACIBKX_31990 [Streptomyces sp. NPDC050658]|uniref:hypothetical protein n=1 Tax=unclassified Streptomyces TaxID=2593676 RepID=UPI0034250654
MIVSILVVYGFALVAAFGSWWYFRRQRINRPPFGVVNLGDVTMAMTGLVLIPLLYMALPLAVVVVLLAFLTLGALQVTLEPVIGRRLLWPVVLTLIAADVVLGLTVGVRSDAFLLINNTIMLIVVIGVANLWAQSGLKAAHAAVFAAVFTFYDALATWQFNVMFELIVKLTKLPLFPLVGWGLTEVRDSFLIGLGDLLLVSLFPLVMRKAYGRKAALCALLTGLATTALVLVLIAEDTIGHTIPVMVFLGPVIVAQYLYWRLTRGVERPTRQYLRAEPLTPRTLDRVTGGGEQG